jgi:catechol 2,3-dioxygenase-like lactoylglutathione lyase family enzyme
MLGVGAEQEVLMSVVGIGGVFFRASDPGALRDWYEKHLGVIVDYASPWVQAPGPTLFMPFPRDTDHFPADKQWMINFRVGDLVALIEALRDGGIEVTTDPAWDTPETGKFARVYDPEGNAVELWEPPVE